MISVEHSSEPKRHSSAGQGGHKSWSGVPGVSLGSPKSWFRGSSRVGLRVPQFLSRGPRIGIGVLPSIGFADPKSWSRGSKDGLGVPRSGLGGPELGLRALRAGLGVPKSWSRGPGKF